MAEEDAKKEESKSEEKNESDLASFDQEKEQAQVWTGKVTAFVGDQLRSAAPSLPIIGGGITGGLTWLSQHDTVKTVIAGGVGFIVTGIFTYGSAWSKAFLEVARAKGKDHGKGSALTFFVWLDKGLEKIRWQLADPDGKYLISLLDSDCRYDDIEGVDNGHQFGVSTPELDKIFVNLELSKSSGSDPQRQGDDYREEDIWRLLQRAESKKGVFRLLVKAPGGRGKTTLLRHLTYNYAKKTPKQNAPMLIPVMFRLRKWQEEIVKTDGLDLPGLIEKHIKQDVSKSLDLPKNWAKNHLNNGKMLVLFDGFDEVKLEHSSRVSQWLGQQINDFRKNYFILTSRPKGYDLYRSEHKPKDFVFINEFKDDHIQEFIKNWYSYQEPRIQSGRSLRAKEEAAKRKAEDLINQLFAKDESGDSSQLLALARNPLNLNMIVCLHWARSSQPLPQQRVELFRRIFDLQLIHRPEARGIDMILDNNEEKHRQQVLQRLALEMGNNSTIEYDDLVRKIKVYIQDLGYPEYISAKDFVEQLIHVSELILKKDEYYEFAHNHFQSYLIALEVKRLKEEKLLYDHWAENLWQEACILYAAILVDPTIFINHFYNLPILKAQELAEKCYREIQEKKRQGLEHLKKNRQNSLYQQLETFLKNGQWKEADKETDRLMLQIVGKEADQWLSVEDIQNFPCEDLRAIDKLWVDYSQGKFGFSVQKKVWMDCGGVPGEYDWDVYEKFADQVGWRRSGDWLSYDELTFLIEGSKYAHLPKGWLWGGRAASRGGGDEGISFLAHRLVTCSLSQIEEF